MLEGSLNIVRAAYEVQMSPADVINMINGPAAVAVTGSSGGGVGVHSGQGNILFPSVE